MTVLNLNIISPSRSVFSGDVRSITVPGTDGSFQVLKNHAPIISSLEIGIVKIEMLDGSTEFYSVSGGTVEVLNNKITLLADSIEKSDEIDPDRARAALNRARERLAERGIDKTIDVARAEAAAARAQNRLNIYEKYLRGVSATK
jgi:F-type H+-transporting ATPase subunit epsilon